MQRVGVLSANECISMFGENYEIFKTCMDFFVLLLLLLFFEVAHTISFPFLTVNFIYW